MAGFSIDGLLASSAPLYALLVLADIVGVAFLIRLRRRRAKLAAARAWTEPLDLQTLRLRMRIVDPQPQSPLPQTRELLDALHGRELKDNPRISGVAGSSRRR
jgi:hypothetical protein